MRGNFRVVVELHRVAGTALRHRTQLRGVTERLCQRQLRPDNLQGPERLDVVDVAAARIDVAQHVTEELVRYAYFYLHHRLEQHRSGVSHRLAHSLDACHAEGHFRRVDRVGRAVNQLHQHVHDRVTTDRTGFERLFDALFRRTDVFLRHRAADGLVFEQQPCTTLARFDYQLDNTLPS